MQKNINCKNTSSISNSHYKSELHKYNLKRSMTEMTSVTETEFLRRKENCNYLNHLL